MDPASIVIFLFQYGASVVLDRLIERIRGEAEESKKVITSLALIEKNQTEILEMLRRQMIGHYNFALASLNRAKNAANNLPQENENFRYYVREAIRGFAEGEAENSFSGLQHAKVLFDTSVCHNLLHDRSNAIASLNDALVLARQESRNEVYVREETSESIEIHLPDGEIIKGVKWEKRTVPQIHDGALALIEQVNEALLYFHTH